MSNKYSFRCNSCGYTLLTDEKAEVKQARDAHKRKTFLGNDGVKRSIKCILVPTDRGTVARPVIADIINEEVRQQKINSLVDTLKGEL